MFRPGNSAAVTRVTAEPKKLSVSPGWVSLEVLKSGALMLFGFLQGKPLMKKVCFPREVGHVSWRLSESDKEILVQKQKITDRKTMQQAKDGICILGAVVFVE